MITTVVCDFGGVLTTPLWDAFVGYQNHSGIDLEQFWRAMGELAERGGANPMGELECGRITEGEFVGALGDQISSQLGRSVDISDFSDVWWSHLHPNEPMLELMRTLGSRGFRMALLTNNVKEWEHRWRPRLAIDEIFELVVDSGFVGVRKPDPAIYALTVERLGDIDPGEILFVDDMDVNCAAARDAGWNTVQFSDNAQAIPAIEAALVADAPQAA